MAERTSTAATSRRVRAERHAGRDRVIDTIAVNGRITDVPIELREWFVTVDPRTRLRAGELAPAPIRIPEPQANRVLRGVIRFVADIPARTDLTMVWENGSDELLVDAASVALDCRAGLIEVSFVVDCDELDKPLRVRVPFAVGRAESPRGLLMSTFTRVVAPPIVADGWSESIVAFAWEALLELARRVSADAGTDTRKQSLVPGAIASEDDLLIIQPMARHDLSGLTR